MMTMYLGLSTLKRPTYNSFWNHSTLFVQPGIKEVPSQYEAISLSLKTQLMASHNHRIKFL